MPYVVSRNTRPSGHGTGTPQTTWSGLVAAVSDGTAFVKGAWAEAFASAPQGCTGILLGSAHQSVDSMYLVDIAIGGAGDEVIIAADIPFEWGVANLNHHGQWVLPIRINEGMRVSVRAARAAAGAGTMNLALSLVQGNCFPYTYNRVINPAGSARGLIHSGTGWLTLVASVDKNYKAFIPCFGADGGAQADAQNVCQLSTSDPGGGNEKRFWYSHFRNMTDGDVGPMGSQWQYPHPRQFQIGETIRAAYGVANIAVSYILFLE